MPTEHEIGGALKAQGLVSMISSVFGGMPTSAFGQNVGIIVSNRVINRWVFAGAAFIFLAAGLVPKLSAVLTMIPQPVIGGATISVFGTITLNGIRILVKDGLTARRTYLASRSHSPASASPSKRLSRGPRNAGLDRDHLWNFRHHALRDHGDRPQQHLAAGASPRRHRFEAGWPGGNRAP